MNVILNIELEIEGSIIHIDNDNLIMGNIIG